MNSEQEQSVEYTDSSGVAESELPTTIEDNPVVIETHTYILDVRDLVFVNAGMLDCEVNHSELGWIPFTANEADTGESSVAVFKYIKDNNINISELPVSPKMEQLAGAVELMWRDSEMNFIADELLKVEDEDPTAVGTTADWRKYRIALRSWPDSEYFPDTTKRPTRPT